MPNRILKESVCVSESLAGLSDFEENFFYRLIVNCDDYGRLDARLPILKARCYPLREGLTTEALDAALAALVRAGCVERYAVDGKPYLRLPSWDSHQQVRAKRSKYPAPDSMCNQLIADDSTCPRNPIQSESLSESESEPAPPYAAASYTHFIKPSVAEVTAYCRERGNCVDAGRFVDFYESKGWKVGSSPMRDWRASVRNWEKSEESPQKRGSPLKSDPAYGETDYSGYEEMLRGYTPVYKKRGEE